MTSEELNADLYRKMFDEQEQYRKALLLLPPEKILDHAYEYAAREDILMSLEYHDLSESQAKALMKSEHPLRDIFRAWEDKETDYMQDIWDTVEDHANDMVCSESSKANREAR